MLFVFDAPAIIAVASEARDPEPAFDALTDLVQNEQLSFADAVLDELGRLARREIAHTWAKAIAGSRCHRGAAYNYVEWVMHDFLAWLI
jgi:hypothetical protein